MKTAIILFLMGAVLCACAPVDRQMFSDRSARPCSARNKADCVTTGTIEESGQVRLGFGGFIPPA